MAGTTSLKNIDNYEPILLLAKEEEESSDNNCRDTDEEEIEQAKTNILMNVEPRERDTEEERNQQTLGVAVSIISHFISETVGHPFVVLRRQCQVNHRSNSYCLTPFAVLPTLVGIQRHQGLSSFWKGFGSKFLVRGLVLTNEAVIGQISTSHPRRSSKIAQCLSDVALKSVSFFIVIPFYTASLLETLQCNFGDGSSSMFNLNCVTGGFNRLLGRNLPRTTRLLPYWKLALPTVSYHVLHYALTSAIQKFTFTKIRDVEEGEEDANRVHTMTETYYSELAANFVGTMITDILLYPLETVIHRLLVQGTRTIIDNTDTGVGVVPLDTSYDGALDCCTTMISEEGTSSLYKGIGALIAQYVCSYALLRSTKYILDQLSDRFQYNRTRRVRSL